MLSSSLSSTSGDVSLLSTFSALVMDFENEQYDKTADALLWHLNELSTRFGTFNCEDVNQRQFISSLNKIMSLVEGHSTLAWCSLSLLENLSQKNVSTPSMIYLQKLTPAVSKLIPYALTEERKIRVLKVLQTLTYGIKVQRPETYIGPLLVSLINWSKAKNQDSVLQLCLSVLTNLLHQNNVTLHILMQTVNLKDLMNDILCLRFDNMCKMEVCKLMMLLEDLIHERPDVAEVTNFLKVTFCTVLDSSTLGNKSSLHHCISFFADMVMKKKITRDSFQKTCFLESTRKVTSQLEEGLQSMDLECAMFLFKFLRIIVGIRVPAFFTLYPEVLHQGLAWVSKYTMKASEAIRTMHAILDSHDINSQEVESAISSEDIEKVFLPLLNGMITIENTYYFQTCLLKFLKEVLGVDAFKPTIKESLQQQMILSFLESVPKINLGKYAECEAAVTMHVYLLSFLNNIVSCCDGTWLKFYMSFISTERVISVLSIALLHGSCDLRAEVLSLICSVGFSGESLTILAKTMTKCASGELASSEQENKIVSEQIFNQSSIETKGVEINKLIQNLKYLLKQNMLQKTSTSHLLELYEYKEQINLDYNKSLLASLTNATAEKALLQDNIQVSNKIISELRQELYRVQPVLESVSHKYDSALKVIEENRNELETVKTKFDKEISNCQETIRTLHETNKREEKEIKDHLEKIQTLKAQLVQKTNHFASLEESKQKLVEERDSLLAEVRTFEEEIKGKEETAEEMRNQNVHLLSEVRRLEDSLKSKSIVISQLEEEKLAKDREIQELHRVQATIFELTGGGKKMF